MSDILATSAGAGSRLLAWLLDALLLAGLALLLLVTAVEIGVGVEGRITDSLALARALDGSVMLQLAPLSCVPLLVVFRFMFDATPGQLLAGIRVVAVRGGPPASWQVLARGPAFLLALLPLGLGVLWMFRDSERRAMQDLVTGTRVVVEDESRLPLASLDALL